MGVIRVRYTHEDMIDFILMNPAVSQNEIAARYGYSPAWVSTLLHSDAIQSRIAARRAEVVNPLLSTTLNERMTALAHQAVEVLQEKLSRPAEMVSDQLALQAAALGAKSLGLGAPPPPPPGDELSRLAERLVAFTRSSRGVVDVEAREVPTPANAGESYSAA